MRNSITIAVRCTVVIISTFAAVSAMAIKPEEPGTTSGGGMIELGFTSATEYKDPFNEVELDVIFTTPSGTTLRVPAFWSGGKNWRVRYTSREPGRHAWRSECSDSANAGLHGLHGEVEVREYVGNNPLYKHGAIRVAADHRHFEQADGTPFLWLGDSCWMGLCARLKWPDEFKTYSADRAKKGFNVIQIVAGLYPDMPAFDPRGLNEAGSPWEEDYARIRPEYFDMADRRIEHLVDAGLMPCVVGAWGYHLPWLGVEKMKKHWRYLAARWGALPVVWCVAGEGTMSWYLSKDGKADAKFQKHGWTEVAAYLRKIDPYHRLITIHPSQNSRNSVDDVSVLDFDMLQTGHGGDTDIPGMLRAINQSLAAEPKMPVLVGEMNYEGIGMKETCLEDVQRRTIYAALLSGEAGHTYGSNGIWQLNRKEQMYGKSPHGGNWGIRPWDEAMNRPGSTQAGLAKRLLEKHEWTKFEPHPEWAAYANDPDCKEWEKPRAAGWEGERIVYVPKHEAVVIKQLKPDKAYKTQWFDPVTGKETDWGEAKGDQNGSWKHDAPEPDHDWVLVLN